VQNAPGGASLSALKEGKSKNDQLVAFGDALIWSLEQQFGSTFTPEMREAWTLLYKAVQAEMIASLKLEPQA
jgi:hypothetical protein